MLHMRINKLLVFNICFIAAFGWWWAASRLVEQDHNNNSHDIIIAQIPVPQLQQEHTLHYDSSFADAEPYGMMETFDTVYFDGYTEEPITMRH